MKDTTKRYIRLFIISLIALIAIILIGPADYFTHGFFCNEDSINAAYTAGGIVDTYHLKRDTIEVDFSPSDNHFTGFEIFLTNQPENNTGDLQLTTEDKKGKMVEEVSVDLSKVKEATWYKVYTTSSYTKGDVYTLTIHADGCDTYPNMLMADPDYLGDENIAGDLLIGYAYAEPTFSFSDKVLIILLIVAAWLILLGKLFDGEHFTKLLYTFSAILFFTAILSWNYMNNSMNKNNTDFDTFQSDSESLVQGVLDAEHAGEWIGAYNGFGLGTYRSLLSYRNDDVWVEGYSIDTPQICINADDYSRACAVLGNYIEFANGDMFKISEVVEEDAYLYISFDTSALLNTYKYGKLQDAFYCIEDGTRIGPLNRVETWSYGSQYGLQGKVFRHFARYMEYENATTILHLICSIATALVFAVIVILLYKKYNMVLAGVFLVTFWLSPWVVNFARNLYWVEFTWFIPMAIGLFCSWKIESRACRILSYVATIIAIFGKSLCGYEYLTTIMLGLIAFLLVDLGVAVVSKNKQRGLLLFRTILIIGVAALVGFALALMIHAPLRGNGDIALGLKSIIEGDVLRRTSGADLNEFDAILWPSFNASVWETVCTYFHFKTELISGIDGRFFPVVCIAPLAIFGYEYRLKKMDVELFIMYIVFFVTSVSWFCLAKGHSYIHVHMNYVLWYFGYVQICFYAVINKMISWLFVKYSG